MVVVTAFTHDVLLKINSVNLTIKHKCHGLEADIKRYIIRCAYLAGGFSVVHFGNKAPNSDSSYPHKHKHKTF